MKLRTHVERLRKTVWPAATWSSKQTILVSCLQIDDCLQWSARIVLGRPKNVLLSSFQRSLAVLARSLGSNRDHGRTIFQCS